MKTQRCAASAVARLAMVAVFGVGASAGVAPTLAQQAPTNASPQALTINGTQMLVYPFGAVQAGAVWRSPGWKMGMNTPIEVCWENLAAAPAKMRDAVKNAVATTWGFHGMVSFIGWNQCKDDAQGIRIGISTTQSGTVALGNKLAGVRNGMLLQVDFSSYDECKGEKNEFCVRATAVHEFGHALAFAHEQNRDDAPDWCKAKHSGDLPDKKITDYDPQSIMNYCNKAWNNNGLLSNKDVEAVTRVYGARA